MDGVASAYGSQESGDKNGQNQTRNHSSWTHFCLGVAPYHIYTPQGQHGHLEDTLHGHYCLLICVHTLIHHHYHHRNLKPTLKKYNHLILNCTSLNNSNKWRYIFA